MPSIKSIPQNALPAWIQQKITNPDGTTDFRQPDFDNNIFMQWILKEWRMRNAYFAAHPEIHNICLQLNAFKKVRDSFKEGMRNPMPVLIAIDNANKELKNATTLKRSSRWLHYLSLVLVVGIAPALYSSHKYGTMFYASNSLEKKEASARRAFKKKIEGSLRDDSNVSKHGKRK